MEKDIRPMVFRNHGRALALTIPAAYVQEMGLVAGDTALVKREPDGLRLRIVRHSKLVELANAQDTEATNVETEEAQTQETPEGTETKADVVEAEAAVDTS